jgi:hypothetical protein
MFCALLYNNLMDEIDPSGFKLKEDTFVFLSDEFLEPNPNKLNLIPQLRDLRRKLLEVLIPDHQRQIFEDSDFGKEWKTIVDTSLTKKHATELFELNDKLKQIKKFYPDIFEKSVYQLIDFQDQRWSELGVSKDLREK